MGLEEQLPGGILLSTVEKVARLCPQKLPVAGNIRIGVLCDQIGDRGTRLFHCAVRDGTVLGHAAAGRSDDRGGPGQPRRWRRYCARSMTRWRAEVGSGHGCVRLVRWDVQQLCVVQGVDHVPVGIYLPGCRRARRLLHAILKLHERFSRCH